MLWMVPLTAHLQAPVCMGPGNDLGKEFILGRRRGTTNMPLRNLALLRLGTKSMECLWHKHEDPSFSSRTQVIARHDWHTSAILTLWKERQRIPKACWSDSLAESEHFRFREGENPVSQSMVQSDRRSHTMLTFTRQTHTHNRGGEGEGGRDWGRKGRTE